MKETILYWFQDQNKKWEEMNQLQRICPCCRDIVIECLFNKRSIFDINITICNMCANNEKAMPSFNWVKDTGIFDKKLREECIF